eukprot:TRINITY_DN2342_c0_g1_i2.p1 TRINITY_DN2342_c0_g1~~TRINITY_DN2342_c0_g1_i2.p1  ORF type:complete len:419 (+),score=87.60 TRINITY_DN2342_c0_g1_i2:59-1258(+)
MSQATNNENNHNDPYVPPVYEVPRDPIDPSFVLSHAVDDAKGILSFFNQFGFVVVRDVLSKEDCEATIEDIWQYIESRGFSPVAAPPSVAPVSRHDPSTWINRAWPAMYNEGIVGTPPVFTARALQNRQNENLHRVASTLFGRNDLLISQDRYGFFRPTKAYKPTKDKGGDDSSASSLPEDDPSLSIYRLKEDHPEWATARNLHLDMNPWVYVRSPDDSQSQRELATLRYHHDSDFIEENNEVGCMAHHQLHIQGLINLADNRESDGGFHLVPGFHHHLREWVDRSSPALEGRYGSNQNFIVLPPKEPIQKHAVRITARAGSIVIWDQRVAHGSSPNSSSNPRFAQFFKVFPVPSSGAGDAVSPRMEARGARILTRVKQAKFDGMLTDHGAKMFGLTPY